MKILKLTFKNLNSLVGEFHLDFDEGPLAEAGIFAITGPTGAGKTTILDAMTLALFGKAARYDEERSPEHMMSRGTGECSAEVLFETGKGRYFVRWDMHRGKKRPDGKVQPVSRELATEDGEVLAEKVREVDDLVVELTGMDYPRFLRSVLLAQGRFREFLDARPADRGELLERITGTEIYSRLSIAAHETARDKQTEIDLARRELAGIRLLEAGETERLGAESADLEARKVVAAGRLKEVIARLELHTRHGEVLRRKQTLEERAVKLKDDRLGFAPEQTRLDRHEQTVPLAGDLREWQGCERRVKEMTAEFAVREREHRAASADAARTLIAAAGACAAERGRLETVEREGRKKQETLRGKIAGIEAWQAEHAGEEKLEEALPAVRERGEACRAAVSAAGEGARACDEIRGNIARRKKAIDDLAGEEDKARKLLETRAHAVQETTRQRDARAEGQPREHWRRSQDNARAVLQVLSELKHANAEHARLTADVRNNEAGRQTLTDELESGRRRLDDLAQNLTTQSAILRDKEILRDQALTIASLEEQRGRLADGEPCPLCGATDHPYAAGNLPSAGATEEAYRRQKQLVADLEQEQGRLQKDLAAREASLTALEKQHKVLANRLDEVARRFAELAAARELTIGDTAALERLQQVTEADLRALTERLADLDRLEKELARAETERVRAEADLKSLKDREKQFADALAEDTGNLADREARTRELEKRVAEALERFNGAAAPWNASAPDPARTSVVTSALEERARAWRTRSEEKDRHTAAIKQLDYELGTLTEQSARLVLEREKWERKLAPFADLAPAAAPEIPPAYQQEPARSEAGQTALDTAAARATRLEGARVSLKTAEEHRQVARRTLEKHLQDRGFSDIPALEAALLPDETLTTLRRRRQALESEQAQLTALDKELSRELEELTARKPPSADEAGTLQEEHAALEAEQTVTLGRLGEIRAVLEADRRARADQASRVERIEKMVADARQWMILRDLIGSADGSKFSRFAQGLTLAQLVSLANRHLRDLNPRYSIERVPGEDLELEIIDHYQADAVRPTRSLSGGESFLVSLSLALGLSELAGRNTRIESLFIDEGFGSLDTDTLDVALAALENLRLKNHTIGVISHVEALKNRLGTQLEVIRQSDGHARLNIVE